MDGLKFLVIFILLTVGISGEESREGRGCSDRQSKPNTFRRRGNGNPKKVILVGGFPGHKYTVKNGVGIKPLSAQFDSDKEQHLKEVKFPTQPESNMWDSPENDNANDNNADLMPPTFGEAKRITISEDGEISFGRSLNFDKLKHFHADDEEDNHDHDHIMGEDHDHNHKSFRTARSANLRTSGNADQLASTLSRMQIITGNQGGHAWNAGEVNAYGGEVIYGSSGESYVDGAGTMGATGVVTVTSSGEWGSSGGWKSVDTQTLQGISVGNLASAGEYLDATLSGLEVSVTNSGSSSTSGTGTVSASGSTTVVNQGGSSGGWRAPPPEGVQTSQGVGVNNGVQSGDYLTAALFGTGVGLGSSGGSSASGTGSIASTGTTNVFVSGLGSGSTGWGSTAQ